MTDAETEESGSGHQEHTADASEERITGESEAAGDSSELPGEDGAVDEGDSESLTAVMLYEGKQYVIRQGKVVVLPIAEKIYESQIVSSEILMAKCGKTILGTPFIEGASASLTGIWPQVRREVNFKRRRRKNSSKRTKGIRIYSMQYRVDDITVPGLENQPREAESTF